MGGGGLPAQPPDSGALRHRGPVENPEVEAMGGIETGGGFRVVAVGAVAGE